MSMIRKSTALGCGVLTFLSFSTQAAWAQEESRQAMAAPAAGFALQDGGSAAAQTRLILGQ